MSGCICTLYAQTVQSDFKQLQPKNANVLSSFALGRSHCPSHHVRQLHHHLLLPGQNMATPVVKQVRQVLIAEVVQCQRTVDVRITAAHDMARGNGDALVGFIGKDLPGRGRMDGLPSADEQRALDKRHAPGFLLLPLLLEDQRRGHPRALGISNHTVNVPFSVQQLQQMVQCGPGVAILRPSGLLQGSAQGVFGGFAPGKTTDVVDDGGLVDLQEGEVGRRAKVSVVVGGQVDWNGALGEIEAGTSVGLERVT